MPVSGPEFVRYGGNTSCVEVRAGERVFVLDAGTGIVPLGRKLRDEGCRAIDLFLSHGHYDHIAGLAAFAPLHDPQTRLTVWHASGPHGDGLSLLERLLCPPFLPFRIADVSAHISFRDLEMAGQTEIGDGIGLRTAALNHPGGNTALSVETAERRLVYACDFEHDNGAFDAALVELLSGADLALLDCTYTSAEYPAHRGFGHTFWEKSAEIAARAGLGRWAAFHHGLQRTDEALDAIAENLSRVAPRAFVARQAQTIDLAAG